MPAWLEILIDLAGFAGFLAIARFNRSGKTAPEQARPSCCVS